MTTTDVLVRLDRWAHMRGAFTEDEKRALNAAIVSQVVCPRAVVVDTAKLAPALAEALRLALKNELRAKQAANRTEG